MSSSEIKTMRLMEWERVKGGIRAILASYWGNDEVELLKLGDIAFEFIEDFGKVGELD